MLLLHFGLMALLATLGWSGWIQSLAGAYTLYALVVAYFVLCMVLPWRYARRSGRAFVAKWYNRWYVYLLYAVVIGIPTAYLLLNKEKFFGFANYRTPSGAMEPTLQVGDVFMVDTRPDTIASVKAGDVVVFGSWKDPRVMYVKRLIALPGQRVTFGANGALVDGHQASREGVQGSDLMSAGYMRYADMTLGSNEFYVMGDNRGNSFDSRAEGPVQRSALHGKVTTVFWTSHATPLGQIAELPSRRSDNSN